MNYKSFIIMFLLFNVFYIPLVFSSSSKIDQLKKERDKKHEAFLEMTSQIDQCGEELKILENQVVNADKEISSKRVFCQDMTSDVEYQKCLDSISEIITHLENLQNLTMDTQKRCPLFAAKSFLDRLLQAIQSAEDDRMKLNKRYQFIVFESNMNQSIYEENKLSTCYNSVLKIDGNILYWANKVRMEVVTSQDMYLINQGLSALEVSRDYISSLKEVCLSSVDSQQSSSHPNYADLIEKKEKQVKEKVEQIFAIGESIDFQQAAKTMCKILEDKNKDTVSLCENPLNNPSWIYSAHYLLNAEDKQNQEKPL